MQGQEQSLKERSDGIPTDPAEVLKILQGTLPNAQQIHLFDQIHRSELFRTIIEEYRSKQETKKIVIVEDVHGPMWGTSWQTDLQKLLVLKQKFGINIIAVEGWAGHDIDKKRGRRFLNAEAQLLEYVLNKNLIELIPLEKDEFQMEAMGVLVRMLLIQYHQLKITLSKNLISKDMRKVFFQEGGFYDKIDVIFQNPEIVFDALKGQKEIEGIQSMIMGFLNGEYSLQQLHEYFNKTQNSPNIRNQVMINRKIFEVANKLNHELSGGNQNAKNNFRAFIDTMIFFQIAIVKLIGRLNGEEWARNKENVFTYIRQYDPSNKGQSWSNLKFGLGQYFGDPINRFFGTWLRKIKRDRKIHYWAFPIPTSFQKIIIRRRDTYAVEKTLEVMAQTQQDSAVIFFGAGHTKGLIKDIKKRDKGASIIVIGVEPLRGKFI